MIGGIVLVIACIYVVRLFSLQVLNDDYKQHADGNAFLKKTQYPSRGLIYDRNGKLLVFNQPAYDVMMIVREVRPFDTLDFCRTVGITKEQFDKRMVIRKMTVPFGVIGVIYEARPNVTFDVFSLCFKSGNACVLKGGSDADSSNRALVAIIHDVLARQDRKSTRLNSSHSV